MYVGAKRTPARGVFSLFAPYYTITLLWKPLLLHYTRDGSFFANPLEVIGPHFRGQVFSSLEKKRRHRLKQYISKTATICIIYLYILHMYLPNYVFKIMRILVLCIDYILFLEIKYSSTYLCRYLAFCSQIS